MTDKEKNELIQEFMGWKLVFMPSIPEHKGGWAFQNQFTGETLPQQYNDSQIPFCSDWNWLMKGISSFKNCIRELPMWKCMSCVDDINGELTSNDINNTSIALCNAIIKYNLPK